MYKHICFKLQLRSYLKLSEDGRNALQLLCSGEYKDLASVIETTPVKDKYLAYKEDMYRNINTLVDEEALGNQKRGSESFNQLVIDFVKKFHVPVQAEWDNKNLLDLLLESFIRRFEESKCDDQHCKALIRRVSALLCNGLRPPSPSFNRLYLYLCFEHRYLLQEFLGGFKEISNPAYRADLSILELILRELEDSDEVNKVAKLFSNYIRWCVLLTERSDITAAMIVSSLAKLCRANALNNSLNVFPEDVFLEMTCDGNTLYSLTILMENNVVFKDLISRESFDPRHTVWRNLSTQRNEYLNPLTSSESKSKGKKRKERGTPQYERKSSTSGLASNNAMEEILRKRWLGGMSLLIKHMQTEDAVPYAEILFGIIKERWYDGLKAFCDEDDEMNDAKAVGCMIAAALNEENPQGLGPLHLALDEKWTLGCKILIHDKRLPINKRDKRGLTALHVAMDDDNFEVVIDILQHRANDVEVNTTDTNARMLIHKALDKGQSEVIKMLLSFPQLDLVSRDR